MIDEVLQRLMLLNIKSLSGILAVRFLKVDIEKSSIDVCLFFDEIRGIYRVYFSSPETVKLHRVIV